MEKHELWLDSCSKKEAIEAFKEQFGYSYPLSFGQKLGRLFLVTISPIPGLSGAVTGVLDKLTNGKLGIKKFVTGQGNNDAAYVKNNDISTEEET